MSWTLLFSVVLALGLALLVAWTRRAELRRMERRLEERERAVRQGSAEAQLQHPIVDLSRCLGCGTCVSACPEEGVLELVHGQAMVVNGARCVGHAACERECPVGAITVTLANLDQRKDVPALTDELEAIGSPGVFLAGEVTAHALIKTAIEHGTRVAAEVARRSLAANQVGELARDDEVLDLVIVGMGPAGLACALEAKRQGLYFVALEQEIAPGGTVAKYPRRRLVVTQPVELPLYGEIGRKSFTKEELVELWHGIATEQELPIHGGEIFEGVEQREDGVYVVRTQNGAWTARHVCLALGRRGTPRKLGVSGEDLPKVAYSLLDANSYQDRRILVVGGGDTAVEAAMGLAEQPGNQVTLSYRREAFFRIRARNERRLERALETGKLRLLLQSEVVAIRHDAVDLALPSSTGHAGREIATLPNDEVFVMAGGIAPFEVLERSGVSFDPALREHAPPPSEQGTGLVRALTIGFCLALFALAWALWFSDYYMLHSEARGAAGKHAYLRSGRGAGLFFGIAATVLIVVNLLYLVRRSPRLGFRLGSLRAWMTSHVATGILALLCATLHSSMAPRDTVGGHALAALALLLVTGAIGRYFYAVVPRAANGRELELEEVKLLLARMGDEWDRSQRGFVDRAREEVGELIRSRQWKSSFLGRVVALVSGQRQLKRTLASLAEIGRSEGVPEERIEETLHVARTAHRTAMAAAHLEDLRAVLNSWRYVHRWVAALMVLLIVLHVFYVLSYGGAGFDGMVP